MIKSISNKKKFRSLRLLLINKKSNSMRAEILWFNSKRKWILSLRKSFLSFSKKILSFKNKFKIFKKKTGNCKFFWFKKNLFRYIIFVWWKNIFFLSISDLFLINIYLIYFKKKKKFLFVNLGKKSNFFKVRNQRQSVPLWKMLKVSSKWKLIQIPYSEASNYLSHPRT
jgi:hypothetical protein